MDVVGMARAGIYNAVAGLGTAITEEQIGLAWRMAAEPILTLDGDQAGLRAAYRVIDRALPLLKPGYSLRFAILPAGKDPDDVVSEGGAEALQAVLAKAMSMIDLLWEREIEAAPWDTPERAAALKKRLRDAVSQVRDSDVRALYGQEIRARLDKLLGESGVPYSARRADNRVVRPRFRAQPSSEARRSALATGAQDWSQREALIVLCVFNHPALLLSQRDLFETIEIKTVALDELRIDIIDYFDNLEARSADASGLDNGALAGHLISEGKQNICERLAAMPEARRLSFVRAESGLEEVMAGWLEVTRIHHKLQTLAAELEAVQTELEVELARDGTQTALDRLLAIKNEIAALEREDGSAA